MGGALAMQDEAIDALSVVNALDTASVTREPESYVDGVVRKGLERQAMYVHLLGQGWGKRGAAREAGYPARIARTPNKVIETPELKAKMQAALKRQGATMDKAARVVSEAMNANLTASFEGEVVQSAVPDHKTRVSAAKVTADLMGVTAREDGTVSGTALTLTIGGALAERIAERMYGNVIEGQSA